jgi:transcriptional regulator with XRE-family HTH domain
MAPTNTIAVLSRKPLYTVPAIPRRTKSGNLIPMGYLGQLKALRKKRGLSQAQLAEIMGVEQPTIQRWETGSRMPDLDSLTALAKALGVSAGSLLDGDDLLASIGPTLFIKGEVQAGAWRAAAELPPSDWQTFTGRSDVNARVEHRFGLRVLGDSMDLLYPPGSIVECVSVFGNAEAMPGRRVVIVRKNDREEFEATVKELVEQDGELWAVPRSTNLSHRPFKLLPPEEEPGILETRIVAVVVASIRPE